MNLSFEHTLLIDGKNSYIASLALINPSHLCPCEAHNRAEYRRAAKLKRSPEQNSQTIQQLSPIAIPLESGNILSVNLAKQRLLDWAKRSHIQSLVYITFDSNGQLLVEYWAYEGSCLSSLAVSPYRLIEKQTLAVGEKMMIHIGDYQQIITTDSLRKKNQQLHNNLQTEAATTGSDILSILNLATNGAGIAAWRYRRKVYSFPEEKGVRQY